MTKRMDAVSPRKRKTQDGEKTHWVNVGSLWIKDDGKMSLTLDAYPMPDTDGRVVIHFFEAKQKDGQRVAVGTERPAARPSLKDEMDDEIPF